MNIHKMQLRYLFITKFPRFQAASKINSLFTLDAVPVKFKGNALHKHSVFKWVSMFHPVLSLLPKKPHPF